MWDFWGVFLIIGDTPSILFFPLLVGRSSHLGPEGRNHEWRMAEQQDRRSLGLCHYGVLSLPFGLLLYVKRINIMIIMSFLSDTADHNPNNTMYQNFLQICQKWDGYSGTIPGVRKAQVWMLRMCDLPWVHILNKLVLFLKRKYMQMIFKKLFKHTILDDEKLFSLSVPLFLPL